MPDDDPMPADPFAEVSDMRTDAMWLREYYDSYVDVGFTEDEAMRLCRDHLRFAHYGLGSAPPDAD